MVYGMKMSFYCAGSAVGMEISANMLRTSVFTQTQLWMWMGGGDKSIGALVGVCLVRVGERWTWMGGAHSES